MGCVLYLTTSVSETLQGHGSTSVTHLLCSQSQRFWRTESPNLQHKHFLIKKIHISFYCVSKQEGDSLNVEYMDSLSIMVYVVICWYVPKCVKVFLSGETAQLSGNDTVVRRAILSLFHPVLMFFHDMILTGRTDEIWCLSFQISRILDFEHVSVKCLMQMPPSVTCVCTGSLFFQLI